MAIPALVLQPKTMDAILPSSLHHGLDRGEDIEIYLTTTGSNPSVIPLKVWSLETIASVKMRIPAREGFSMKNQRLKYGGRELSRLTTPIKDYGVINGEMLRLVLKLSELQIVTITTVSGKQHTFRIDRMKRVRDLKERLSDEEAGLAADEQRLTLRGEVLLDATLIEHLPLDDDAVVHLLLRSSVNLRSQGVGTDTELTVTVSNLKVKPSVISEEEEHGAKLRPVTSTGQVRTLGQFYSRNQGAWHEVPVSIYGRATLNIPSVLLDLVQQVRAGLEQGFSPILSSEGSGGAYFMQSEFGADIVGVFKPTDEEPMALNNPRGLPTSENGEGLKRGTKVGEGALREVAAYILDHASGGQRDEKHTGFAGVPPTVMIRCAHEAFGHHRKDSGSVVTKIGSLQRFVHASSNCEDMGSACFPVHEVHKIAILDMRLANTDRNGANILICKQEDGWNLVPIDHGYCLPDKFEDCTFEWLYWPQAKIPFEQGSLEYIAELDAEADIVLLQDHGWILPAACARVLCVGTMLLKKGAAAGLTPYEIGSMMCREMLNKKSVIENMLDDVESSPFPISSEEPFIKALSALIDKHIQRVLYQKVPSNGVV